MIQKLLNSWIRIATHMPNWQCFWISLSVLTFSLRLAHSSLADYRRLALIPRTLIPRILPHRTSHFTPALPRQFHSNESSWNVRSRGTKSSKGANFQRNESSWNLRSRGTKVPRERKFSLWSFRSRERKCRGTKRPGIVLKDTRGPASLRFQAFSFFRKPVPGCLLVWPSLSSTDLYSN